MGRNFKTAILIGVFVLLIGSNATLTEASYYEESYTQHINRSLSLDTKTITFTDVTQDAFNLKQSVYEVPTVIDIPELDPPIDGNPGSLGLVFQESNAITSSSLIDQFPWYAYARPRAALDKLSFQIYVDDNNDGTYNPKTYADANPNYSNLIIQPLINVELLPLAGKVLSRFVIGHYQQGQGYPQFFDFNANGYAKFNGFVPQTVGSSYRVALHNVFDLNYENLPKLKEDFPRFKEIYFRIFNSTTSNLIGLVDSEGFTGAIDIDLSPGEESTMDVSANFFPRRNILISQEPHTGLVGYSTMFWKNEDDTPASSTDEAHDCDIIVVGYDRDGNGIIDKIIEHDIDNPQVLTITDFSTLQTGNQLYFALENRDRDPSHYSSYSSAYYETRSSYSIQLISSDIPLSMVLYESPTDSEYNDNIVINLVVKQNLLEAYSINDAVTVEYTTKAYFPTDTDNDGVTDQLEIIVGTDIQKSDTDNDNYSDHWELIEGTDPLSPTTEVIVDVGGIKQDSYYVDKDAQKRVEYDLNDGPVVVESTNTVPIIAALRDAWKQPNETVTSFSQLMGLPYEQLSDTYYFPAYNNRSLSGQLRFGNVDTVGTWVRVEIAGVEVGRYWLEPDAQKRVEYDLNDGPVIVESETEGVKIIAALRDAWKQPDGTVTSFVQLMGLPLEQLSDTYYFPAYNNRSLSGQLRFGNVDTVGTWVRVEIAGVEVGRYWLEPDAQKRVEYDLNDGPVIVESETADVKIIAALRDAWKQPDGTVTSFSQLMGLPYEKLSDTYYFPAYNNRNSQGSCALGTWTQWGPGCGLRSVGWKWDATGWNRMRRSGWSMT